MFEILSFLRGDNLVGCIFQLPNRHNTLYFQGIILKSAVRDSNPHQILSPSEEAYQLAELPIYLNASQDSNLYNDPLQGPA